MVRYTPVPPPHTSRRRALPALLALLCLAAQSAPREAGAQAGAGFGRPGNERPALPAVEAPSLPRTNILPPVPIPSTPSAEGLPPGVAILVRRYRVVGTTVLSPDEVARLTEPFVGSRVTYSDLEAARDRITLAYVERGYITSGATIPDQEIVDGVVELHVVEGSLGRIDVRTDGRLVEDYLEGRVALDAGAPVNVRALEKRLQLLQRDERIESLEASLLPGERRGESVLSLLVKEARPYAVRFELGNLESPSVGGFRGGVGFTHSNLTGNGERLDLFLRGADGLQAMNASLEIPVSSRDTTVVVHGERVRSKVVEDPLSALDIKGRFTSFGALLRHPVLRTPNLAGELALGGEYRRAETALLGVPFSFTAGQEDGVSRLFVLRLTQQLSYGDLRQAIAARSTFNLGLDAFGATRQPGDVPDGRFFSWIGQVQWVRRLPLLASEVLVRGDLQLAADPLLSMEQLAVGGIDTVRGYRTNAVIADSGFIGSVELRVPVYSSPARGLRLELAPFVDVGHGWMHQAGGPRSTLLGVGVGIRAALGRHGAAELYWGEALRRRPGGAGDDLQDRGLHFRVSARL